MIIRSQSWSSPGVRQKRMIFDYDVGIPAAINLLHSGSAALIPPLPFFRAYPAPAAPSMIHAMPPHCGYTVATSGGTCLLSEAAGIERAGAARSSPFRNASLRNTIYYHDGAVRCEQAVLLARVRSLSMASRADVTAFDAVPP